MQISEKLGCEGRLCATTSPLKSSNGTLTNLGFYYKKGFRATDEQIHQDILYHINKKEEIPLNLNVWTKIELEAQNFKR